ncbi:MAG: hypothetical protein H6P95_21 [Candidatus Aminicenantes bacterium]|nr:hypothetical protein [Candidatus Aminicenantes bacterium]
MSAVVRFLAGFCRDHPLDEKILLCPSFVAGRQIGEALAREAGSWVNLRFVTLTSLAHQTAALELSVSGQRLISGSELIVFVDTLFRDLVKSRGLEYFASLKPSPGVARTLSRAVLQLRGEGFSGRSVDPGHFAVPAKGRDIRVLLSQYEARMEAERGLDLPGLWTLAAKIARGSGDHRQAHLLCPADIVLSRVEREFLDAVSGGSCLFVPSDPVHGLERPRLFQVPCQDPGIPPGPPVSDVDRLAWLFDPAPAPKPIGDGSLEIFRAVGPVNECREALRRIIEGRTSLDQVELICPPGPAYVTALHGLSLRTGLALTFGDGLPLALTSPGRVFVGLLDWIEAGYPSSSLARLIASLDMRLPFQGTEDDIPAQTVCRHIREAMIGWGRERYVDGLRLLGMKFEAKLQDSRVDDEIGLSESRRNGLARDRAHVEGLARARESFLSFFPDMPVAGPVPLDALCLGLAAALEACVVCRSEPEERDSQALALITAELRALAGTSWGKPPAGRSGPLVLDLESSLDRLRAAVSSLSVGASAPRPGHLHVSSYASGGFSGRPMTFVAGLDDADFPGHGLQDPVLLDEEREKLSPGLPTTADSLRERLYSMASLLASLRGRVILSFPAYDILEDRVSFPSSLVLQVHRLLAGDGRRDYASLDAAIAASAEEAGHPDPAGFLTNVSKTALDGTEWWLSRLAGQDRPPDAQPAVRSRFPALAAGIKAEEARAGDTLSEYEGIVQIEGRLYDPLVNHRLEVSASRLESLVKCPFGYFLKYVLGIEAPEEIELDRSRWLDPMDRGSLIHEILSDFMAKVVAAGERPDPLRHGPLMEEVADRAIDAWKRKIPPPSPGIFEKERQDISAALHVFFNVESARAANVRPFAFEKAFAGVSVDVEGGGSFLLKGRIDRIDRMGEETFRILDYKTGSPKPYEDLKAFGKGRVIQHALYAVAVEKVLAAEGLAREPRVTESGYSFPTRRGEGREVLVREFDRRAFRALLRHILALISGGFFVTSLKDECTYCDFSPVCGGRPAETKRKIKANATIFEVLKRIGSYD